MKDKVKFRGIGRQLIEKLRANGYAFDSIKTVLDRKFKIAKMLSNDAVLGEAISPQLKNNYRLRIEFCVNSIKIYDDIFYDDNSEDNVIGDLVLLHIDNAYERSLNDLVFKIGAIYSQYLHSNNELKEIIETFELTKKREQKLKSILGKLNKQLPLRYWYDGLSEYRFFFGSGVFSIQVSYVKNDGELKVHLILYKNSGRKYTDFFQYESLNRVKRKYVIYIKDIISIKYLTRHTVEIFLKTFFKIKMVEKM